MISRFASLVVLLFVGFGVWAVGARDIVIDGRQGPDEWAGAVAYPLDGGGTVLVRSTPAELQVGFRGLDQGWAHVYISDGDTIVVLHASAALGTATYRRDGELWIVEREFEWGVRSTSLDESASAERQQHFEAEGWIASTIQMGEKTFIEYRINRALLGGESSRVAYVFASSADDPRFWPSTLSDDTLAEQLIFGNSPTPLRFDPLSWSAPEPVSDADQSRRDRRDGREVASRDFQAASSGSRRTH